MAEFQIIEQYFQSKSSVRPDVCVGIGDDAAILDLAANSSIFVTSCCSPIADWHTASAGDALASYLLEQCLSKSPDRQSKPAWITLSLCLPELSHEWLRAFSTHINSANDGAVQLIGGDTTEGPAYACLWVLFLKQH